MAASLETLSPIHLNEDSKSCSMESPLFSPSSEKRFWSALRNRIDVLLEERNTKAVADGKHSLNPRCAAQTGVGDSLGRTKRSGEDTLLLMRGFDSVAQTLSQLSNNLDTALRGANDLAKPPTLTEIFHNGLKRPGSKEEDSGNPGKDIEEPNIGSKRKYNSSHCSEEQREDSKNEKERDSTDGKLKKAKNLAVSMAAKAASLARELKFIKSDLGFMQERCSLLEEENRRLRDGFDKGMRPEEDDLMRLQMEALLGEKSRLANENANLVRENQCLNQLVEYHQLTSQDFDFVSDYDRVMQGTCLDFSSPPPRIPEGDDDEEATEETPDCFQTPSNHLHGFSDSLNGRE